MVKNLFDNVPEHPPEPQGASGQKEPGRNVHKTHEEETGLDRFKNLEEKIAGAINRVKELKEERTALERKIRELEEQLNEKNREIERLSSEKVTVKNQVEELLQELDALNLD
jgi:chromosome segregation ATPase